MKPLDSWIERKESEIQIFELIRVMRTSSHFMGLWVMFQKSDCKSRSSSLKDHLWKIKQIQKLLDPWIERKEPEI